MKGETIPNVIPRWYQDLSIPQMQNVFSLGNIMRVDDMERVTERTQRALGDIGVTSTFVKITEEQIKKYRRLADLDPVKFLCEIYRSITGKSFVDEEYKKVYDCNERIILSAIAFLTLPEAVIELHRRIPMGEAPKLPPKPQPGKMPSRRRAESPYLEPLFVRPDWLTYKKELDIWRKQCQRIAVPRVILPPSFVHSKIHEVSTIVETEKVEAANDEQLESYQEENNDKKKHNTRVPRFENKMKLVQEEKIFDKSPEGMQRSDFLTFTESQTEPRWLDKKIFKNQSEYPKREYTAKKSWLGEKDTQLIIAGSTVNDDSSEFPISLTTSGFAYVTPDNSDDNFFAALSLDNIMKKTYPRGRENLSRKWQEWLQDADEEYKRVEKEANKILKNVEGTLKLMGPEANCDSCCACRQTRKANIKFHKTKMPHIVIDSIAIDGKQNKYVVGSLTMNSPAPSPSESTDDLPEVIPSQDKIINKRILNGVTNEKGETTYYVSGVSKHVEHIPRKVVSYEILPKPIKNVPPCGCAIEKTINESLFEVSSDDNIPWTKNQELCVGKKYRPHAGGASSCQEYPNDKACRRNPFKKKVDEGIKAALRVKDNTGKDDYEPKKRNMYSIADFQPCGDEDGMAVCGGPWGAVNIPDEEELARRAAEEKLILESPPCGDKPGRAICGAPFGTRHPIPKKPKKDDDDEEEEVDEEEVEERKKRDREARKKEPEPTVEKLLNRDPRCSTVPEKNSGIAEQSLERKQRRSKIRKDKKRKTLKENEKLSKSEYESKAKNISEFESSVNLQNHVKTKNKFRKKSKEEGGHRNEDVEITRKRRVKELKDQWNKIKKMVSKFVATPAILPEEAPKTCKREVRTNCCEYSTEDTRLDEKSTKEGPFGWRTKSEQELPPEKTLVYLVEPTESVERVPVRRGGKSCKCRENRNAKKILLYGVSGMTKEGKGKQDEKLTRVIDGLIYITPTPSVRNSDEYIPEYELYDSPYEKCVREGKNDNLKYVERYLGPKSLMVKKSRVSVPCSCSITKDNKLKENEKELVRKDSAGESTEKKWTRAFQDEGLIDFYSRCRDNVPCWLRCAEFSKDGCCTYPRRLQVKRPVCECKYERKIVKREEEKENWLRRQARLKNHKKLPYSQVNGLSRPMQTEANLMISDVKRISREDDNADDIEYCVTGIAQDRVMGPAECILLGIGMHTPVSTPEPSKEDIKIMKDHRHWSPMNIHAQPTLSTNAQTIQLRHSNQTSLRNDYWHETDKRIAKEYPKSKKPDFIEDHDKSFGKNKILSKETDKKIKQLPSVPATTHSVHGTFRKKSAIKLFGEMPKSNVHKRKSTGNILSKGGKAVSSHNDTKEIADKIDMKHLLKIELEKMANEGFLFAKLPACWQIPQLQYWLMYRKGIALPPEEKKKLMEQSLALWDSAEKKNSLKIQAPLFEVPQKVLDKWNYDEADKIKHEIALKKESFQSHVRKLRVLQARNMWSLMEFGKFPGVSFKKAYFTYLASKESDGFVFKPWKNM